MRLLTEYFPNNCMSYQRYYAWHLIPVGTGNDWGRMFGIPLDYEKAIDIISENKSMLHDIGLISYYNGTEKKQRYFINIAGLGFESVVVKRTNIQKDKGRSGKLIYFYNLLMSLLSYKNTSAEIIIDGNKISGRCFFNQCRKRKVLRRRYETDTRCSA